ncbi:MAG TPA: signal peptide peptidase SppA [Thermodesulfobacteriota bacterium]|nr:signal peptide peptidase SppA [Thermodesulfobacteriota bacterium]
MWWRERPLLAGFLLIGGLVAAFLVVVWAGSSAGALRGPGRVAVVEITGVIVDAGETVQALRRHAKDRSVRAVVLRIDSPGGGVGASQEIYEEVERLRTRAGKTVVASMGAVAASGGYYIALAADRIVANPGTITGSIGVIVQLFNLEGLGEKVGVRATVIKSGPFKDIGSPARPLTEEDRRILQGVVDDVYEQFVAAVRERRGLSEAEVRRLADGRILSGRQAKAAGLVDRLGNLWTAIHEAAELAGIPGEPVVLFPEKPRLSLLDLLTGRALAGLERRLSTAALPGLLTGQTMRLSYLLLLP